MTASTNAAILSFRPISYFEPLDLKGHLLSTIKGAERRRHVEKMLRAGPLPIEPSDVLRPALSDAERLAAGRVHPAFMGGEYLPDRERAEVEIARITLASVLQDVTCVYAKREGDRIDIRIVDEYDGDTLGGTTALSTKEPLTLGELVDFFLGAFGLFEVLAMNFADDGYEPDRVLRFFKASSVFYPQLDEVIRDRVTVWVQENQPEPDEKY